MKLRIFLALVLVSLQANAQQHFTYRDDDPFVACYHGQIEDDRCWSPIDHLNTWLASPWCDPPNYWGKSWTEADYRTLGEYTTICKDAIQDGNWKGPGDGTKVPRPH